MSVPSSEIARLLGKKLLQLDDRSRVKFKLKLGASFGRLTAEEERAGLTDPWAITECAN